MLEGIESHWEELSKLETIRNWNICITQYKLMTVIKRFKKVEEKQCYRKKKKKEEKRSQTYVEYVSTEWTRRQYFTEQLQSHLSKGNTSNGLVMKCKENLSIPFFISIIINNPEIDKVAWVILRLLGQEVSDGLVVWAVAWAVAVVDKQIKNCLQIWRKQAPWVLS